MEDIDRKIDAATDAGYSALSGVRVMHRGLDRADAASRLARELRNISEDAANVMHAEVVRAFDAEGLSYGQLATRFGISKSLAH